MNDSRKIFPIHTKTACQLKWVWSTVYLTEGRTASCHRTNHHAFDFNSFDFHNTEQKLKDRQRMLDGLWPEQGCDDCKNIELAGGTSDRITNLNFWQFDPPKELQIDSTATRVTPRLLEIYFNNTCNLKCTYCGPEYSSLWADELQRFTGRTYKINDQFESNKIKLFNWLRENIDQLHQLNILGGEPLYQIEFDQMLDLLEDIHAPQLTITFFSNLAVAQDKLMSKIDRIEKLIKQQRLKKLIISASLDCWGDEQEFARYPLQLKTWEKNFNYILSKDWITIVISSTITPLTIKTLPLLMAKINEWNKQRPVYWYGNTSEDPARELDFGISMFGNVFEDDFNRALDLMPEELPEHISVKKYLTGIRDMVRHSNPDLTRIEKLYTMLDTFDERRNTNWRGIYPWLTILFQQHIGKS